MKTFKINNLLIIALGVGMLSSCSVSKKYERTELNMPQRYRNQITVTADSVQLPWKRFFREPMLISLLEKALQRNNEIAIALKNTEQLDLALKQAKQALLPTVDLSIGANRTWQSKNSLNGSLSGQIVSTPYIDDYGANLRLSWEADIWGKAKMQKAAASANYFAQQENLSALKTRIIVQVAQAYYRLISLDEQLLIAQKNVELSDSTLNMMKLQFDAGQVNSLAVEQMEAQKKTAELLVPLALQNIAIEENALSILCGSYPDKVEREGNLSRISPEGVFGAGVPAELISRRPDVKAAEYAAIVANANTGLARAAMYPSLSLTPQIGLNSFKFNKWFDLPGSITKTLAGNLTQPLFQKRALKTAYESAVLEQEKAVLQFKQTVLVAVGEVSDALARTHGADERLMLIRKKDRALAKATDDALKLYRSGMATYLDVITAQNNKLQNDLEFINVRLESLNATTDLYRSLGGGIN
ncbi:MAG: TolC family protein [Sphingobacterium sp.]|jgi:NodT family efflux transporter outer membrane factor (OMF) lipoprotein|nr:TolC family protein [Sphingobacterium sp.]